MKQKSYVVELKKLARIDRKPSHLSAHWVGHMPPLPFLNPIFGLNYSKIIYIIIIKIIIIQKSYYIIIIKIICKFMK